MQPTVFRRALTSVALATSLAALAGGCTWWTRANVDTTGTVAPDPEEFMAALSADGRYVAFHALGPLDPAAGPSSDIYRRDLRTGEIELVSRGHDGVAPSIGDQDSFSPTISADGRFVAFESYSSNLVPDDDNDSVDIFVRDVEAGTTVRVSVDSAGNQAGADSNHAEISADGRHVVFTSWADDLVADDDNVDTDVFRHDLATAETIRVSRPTPGHPGGGYRPVVSADGNLVLYQTHPTAIPGLTGTATVIVMADIAAGTTTLALAETDGTAIRGARPKDLSGDGRHVVASDGDVLVYDTHAATLTRVDPAGRTDSAMISDDGRFLVFDAFQGGPGDGGHAFALDLATGHRTMLVPSPAWTSGGNEGMFPAISADGRVVAFEGLAATAPSAWGPHDLFVMAHPAPTIDTVAPSTIGPGTTEILLIGRGFLHDTRLLVSDPSVTVSAVESTADDRLLATVEVDSAAPGGVIDIVAWNPGTGAGAGASTTCEACVVVSP